MYIPSNFLKSVPRARKALRQQSEVAAQELGKLDELVQGGITRENAEEVGKLCEQVANTVYQIHLVCREMSRYLSLMESKAGEQ